MKPDAYKRYLFQGLYILAMFCICQIGCWLTEDIRKPMNYFDVLVLISIFRLGENCLASS